MPPADRRPARSSLHNGYAQLLNAARPAGGTLRGSYRNLFQWGIRWLVEVERRYQRIKFPRRTTGDWWWTWRWRWEYLRGWHEYETLRWCRALLAPGCSAIDIGAHIGYFSWHFCHWVGPSGQVLAFEPCPENYPLLKHNLAARRCSNVQIKTVALSDRDGTASLFVSPGNSNHSLVEGFTQAEGILQVACQTLDQILASYDGPPICLVKMDVEGWEPQVLRGMPQTLERYPEIRLIVELNPRALTAGGATPDALLLQLEQLGLACAVIDLQGDLVDLSGFPFDNTENLLCWRE